MWTACVPRAAPRAVPRPDARRGEGPPRRIVFDAFALGCFPHTVRGSDEIQILHCENSAARIHNTNDVIGHQHHKRPLSPLPHPCLTVSIPRSYLVAVPAPEPVPAPVPVALDGFEPDVAGPRVKLRNMNQLAVREQTRWHSLVPQLAEEAGSWPLVGEAGAGSRRPLVARVPLGGLERSEALGSGRLDGVSYT